VRTARKDAGCGEGTKDVNKKGLGVSFQMPIDKAQKPEKVLMWVGS